MDEIDLEQYPHKIKAWEESKKQKIEADDWICEHCQEINKMNMKDKLSCNCKKCLNKNEIIDSMIYQFNR